MKNISFNSENFKGWSLVIAAFAVVFAFSTADHAISPMADIFKTAFAISQERSLWLISSCTVGILLGLFSGPVLIKAYKPGPISYISLLMMLTGITGFVASFNFLFALGCRLIFGLGAGLVSTVLWWLAYESISKKFYTPMITVLTASRPMAVAAGVPLILCSSVVLGWRISFALIGGILVLSMLVFIWALPLYRGNIIKLNFTGAINTYIDLFKTPFVKPFFIAMFINRLCYFGFYSMLGIWFIKKYGFTAAALSKPLMIIGICETAINFIVPILMKYGQRKLFLIAVFTNIVFFTAFILGIMPVWATILLIGLFAMTDRIYNMLLLIFIPNIFNQFENKTVIGSMVTLVSWASLAFISYLEGALLDKIGMTAFAVLLIIALTAGILLYINTLYRTVFCMQNSGKIRA